VIWFTYNDYDDFDDNCIPCSKRGIHDDSIKMCFDIQCTYVTLKVISNNDNSNGNNFKYLY